MKIFIAAAHGARDPGAVANNTTEREECIKIVEQCVGYLKAQNLQGVEIIHVPDYLDLAGEINYINHNSIAPSKDICIEINMNSNIGPAGTGVETFYGYLKLALALNKAIVENTGLADRGVKIGNNLAFNGSTSPGSALVELGFINNSNDLRVVRQKGALALAKGVLAFIEVTPGTTTELPQPTINYQKKYESLLEQFRKYIQALKLLANTTLE